MLRVFSFSIAEFCNDDVLILGAVKHIRTSLYFEACVNF